VSRDDWSAELLRLVVELEEAAEAINATTLDGTIRRLRALAVTVEREAGSRAAEGTDRLITAREVAELLGLQPQTVLAWVRESRLPAFKLPSGQIRFRESEFAVWLAERRVGAGSRATSHARAAADHDA
jgi:excisionase family DNA binding protein